MQEYKKLEEDFKRWMTWNCSTLFLLKPIVGAELGTLYDKFGLIDSYLNDEGRDDEDSLYVLFKPTNMELIEAFIALQASENENYAEDYDYAVGYVVVRFSIPERYKNDYQLFKRGEYSKMSPTFKNKYTTRVLDGKSQEIPSFQYMVFYKDARLKHSVEQFFDTTLSNEDELWTIPSTERETLNIENIKGKDNERNKQISEKTGGTEIKKFHSYRG